MSEDEIKVEGGDIKVCSNPACGKELGAYKRKWCSEKCKEHIRNKARSRTPERRAVISRAVKKCRDRKKYGLGLLPEETTETPKLTSKVPVLTGFTIWKPGSKEGK